MPPCWDVGTRWYLHRLYTSENWSQQLEHKQVPKCGTEPGGRKGINFHLFISYNLSIL